MIRQKFLLAGLAVLAVVAATWAEQPEQPPSSGKPQVPVVEPRGPYDFAPKAASPADARDEEIEIMRRLLQGVLERQQPEVTLLKSRVSSAAFSPDRKTLATEVVSGDVVEQGGRRYRPLYANLVVDLSNSTDSYWIDATTADPLSVADSANWREVAYLDTATGRRLNVPVHARQLHGPEGVYLKGYGVVYTATLALPPTVPLVAEANQVAPKPLSEWIRTRRELRGEKVEPAKATVRESLAEVVLRVLANNGEHLTKLEETELVTVAITLPRVQACTQCHANLSQSPANFMRRVFLDVHGRLPTAEEIRDFENNSSGNNRANSATSAPSGSDATAGRSANPGPRPPALQEDAAKIEAAKAEFQKQILLGDLHMKQGQNATAAVVFERALNAYADWVQLQRRLSVEVKGIPETDPQMEKDYRLTAAKLLQVYAALGNKEEMQKALKRLDAHIEKAWAADGATKPPPSPEKEELPAKLVISAPKKLLDLVGAGKITFEEFCKNATIDHQPAKTIEKQPAGGK